MHSTEDTNTKGRLLSSLIHPCALLPVCSGNPGSTLSAGRARLPAPKPAEQPASLRPSLEGLLASWCPSRHCEAQLAIWQRLPEHIHHYCCPEGRRLRAKGHWWFHLNDSAKTERAPHIKTKTTCLPKLPSYTEEEFPSESEHNETITQIYISYSIYFILKECRKNLMTNHFLFLANTF